MATRAPSPGPPETAPRPDIGRGRWPRRLRWTLKAVVAVAVLALAWHLAAGFDWSALAARLEQVDAPLTAVAAALLLARYLVWEHRYGIALERLGERVSRLRRFGSITASVLVNHVTPYLRVFGGIFRARYLARTGQRSFAQHYGAVLFEQIVHSLTSGVLLWLVGIGLAWANGRRGLAAGGLLAGVALLGYLLHRRSGGGRPGSPLIELATRKARDQAMRFRPLARHGRGLVEVVRLLAGDRSVWLRMTFWTLGFGLLNVAAQWLVFRALDVDAGLLVVVAVVGGGVLVGVFTGSPGGVATTEAAMTAGYIALGVSRTDAAAATLIYRGLHYAVVLLSGVPALLYFELLEKRRRPVTGEARSAARPTREHGSPEDGSPPDRDG